MARSRFVEEENEMKYLHQLRRGLKRGMTLACLSASLVIMAGQAVWSVPRPSGADLSITKTDSPDPLKVGENLNYSIMVTNSGPLSATGVTMTDELPAGVSFVSWSATQGSCSVSPTVACTLGSLGNGATAGVEIVVRADQAGDITNTATVAGKQKDPNQANNQSSASTHVDPQEADLSIAMTDEPDPYVSRTQPLTFTITVHNAGPSNVTSARMRDDLPNNVYLAASITASQGMCGVSYGIVNCDLGELAVGSNATVTIAVWVRCNSTSVINSASTFADELDPVPVNNEATTVTAVAPTFICRVA